MEVVMEAISSVRVMLESAKKAEQAEDIPSAINLYQKVLENDKLNEQAYDRLMVAYRKLKDYKKELSVIDKGIEAFEQLYRPKPTGRLKKVAEISLKMAKSVGLANKEGESVYDPEPLGKWKKRRLVVEKKLAKKK
jgi:tetratricopeptide (TPR) repeat protein